MIKLGEFQKSVTDCSLCDFASRSQVSNPCCGHVRSWWGLWTYVDTVPSREHFFVSFDIHLIHFAKSEVYNLLLCIHIYIYMCLRPKMGLQTYWPTLHITYAYTERRRTTWRSILKKHNDQFDHRYLTFYAIKNLSRLSIYLSYIDILSYIIIFYHIIYIYYLYIVICLWWMFLNMSFFRIFLNQSLGSLHLDTGWAEGLEGEDELKAPFLWAMSPW